MGNIYSTATCNNDLIDYLLEKRMIRNVHIERAFRIVDRGDYMPREDAYNDISCKNEKIHLSAPCIYAAMLHGLSLEPGMSFLNIGSGSGYLSTVAGLLLSKNDVNHGVEQNEELVAYANECLQQFKSKLHEHNAHDFCEPVFQVGNIFNYAPNRQYDRVYCGAECADSHIEFIKKFVRVHGVLVVPHNSRLLRFVRVSETKWKTKSMLSVTFDVLVIPENQQELHELPLYQTKSLQQLCRATIRRHLRKIILPRLKKSKRSFAQFDSDFKKRMDPTVKVTPDVIFATSCDNSKMKSTSDIHRHFPQVNEGLNFSEDNESNNKQDFLKNNEDEVTNENKINQIVDRSDPDDVNSITQTANLEPCSNNIDKNQNDSINDENRSDIVTDSDSIDSEKRENSQGEKSNTDEVTDDDNYDEWNMFDRADDDFLPTLLYNESEVSYRCIVGPKDARFVSNDYESAEKIDSKDLLRYMKEIICQLPIPHAMRLYINFNREL